MEIAATDPTALRSQPLSASRRRLNGLLLGMITGLIYGAVSGYVNHFLLRDVPYYQAPFGSFGNLLAATVIGALAGLAAGWAPQRGSGIFAGVVTAAALGGLRFMAQTWFLSSAAPGNLGGFWIVFLGLGLVFTPVVVLLRMGIDAQEKYRDEIWIDWDRIRWPLVLGVLAMIAGAFWVYSGAEFAALSRVAEVIRQGQAATQPSSLPPELAVERVPGFWEHRDEPFQLLILPPEMAAVEGETLVAAGFESGWSLLCTLGEDQSLRKCEEPQPVPSR